MSNNPRPSFDNDSQLPTEPDRQGYILENVNVNDHDKLTIAKLEDENHRDIWVMNTSAGQFAGVVCFQIPGGDGNLVPIEVPYTFVAVNLSDQVSPKTLLASESFRKVISRRLLTIVTAEHADSINKSSQARRELDNIANGIPIGVAETMKTVSGFGNGKMETRTSAVALELNEVNSLAFGHEEVVEELRVDPRILSIMNNVNMEEDDRLNLLRSNKASIKLVDSFFIRAAASAEGEDSVVDAAEKMIRHLSKKLREDGDFRHDDDFKAFTAKCKAVARTTLRGS